MRCRLNLEWLLGYGRLGTLGCDSAGRRVCPIAPWGVRSGLLRNGIHGPGVVVIGRIDVKWRDVTKRRPDQDGVRAASCSMSRCRASAPLKHGSSLPDRSRVSSSVGTIGVARVTWRELVFGDRNTVRARTASIAHPNKVCNPLLTIVFIQCIPRSLSSVES
jgi:hypothetical protein